MPDDVAREDLYVYFSREEGLAACQTKGLGLCSKEQIKGFEFCSYGWLSDDVGLWMDTIQLGELDGHISVSSQVAVFSSFHNYLLRRLWTYCFS